MVTMTGLKIITIYGFIKNEYKLIGLPPQHFLIYLNFSPSPIYGKRNVVVAEITKELGMVHTGVVVLMIIMSSGWVLASESGLQDIYSDITGGLITIRKEHPVVQPRVYKLLDQVDKLYTQAKTAQSECAQLRKKLQEKQTEAKDQIEAAKRSIEVAKGELSKRFEEQNKRLQALEAERATLVARLTPAPASATNGEKKVNA